MNNSGNIRLHDASFQSQHAAKCDVLFRVDQERLQLAVVDQLQDQLKLLIDKEMEKSPEDELTDLFENEPFLKFNYRKIKVSLTSREFVFIPSEVYSDDMLPSYSSFIGSDEDIRVTHLRSSRVKNVVGLSRELIALFTNKFINPVFFSQADPVIESFLKVYFKPIATQLFFQFNGTTFDAAVVEGKKIRFYNIFNARTPDELNYFLVFLIRELKLNPKLVKLTISGNITEGDAYFSRVAKYFSGITFADSDKLFHASEVFSELAKHTYFSLLGINLCE